MVRAMSVKVHNFWGNNIFYKLIFLIDLVCQCNRTLNLLARSEYFRLDMNIPSDQVQLANLFTPPHTLSLTRSSQTVPTLTLTMTKGPVDLMSMRIGSEYGEFNATVTLVDLTNSQGVTTLKPLESYKGVIDKCLLRVVKIQLEFFQVPISKVQQSLSINLTTCEHTLRKFGFF